MAAGALLSVTIGEISEAFTYGLFLLDGNTV